jgi:carbonic anhydrase
MKIPACIAIFFNLLQFLHSQVVDWNSTYTKGNGNPLYQDSCSQGFIQSPIDVTNSNSYYNFSIAIVYENYSSVPAMSSSNMYINVTDPGSGVNMGNLLFERYGYLAQFNLADIRVKIPAEHTINGVRGSMEIQLIHRKVIGQYFTQNQNLQIPDANINLGISLIYSETVSNTGDNGFAKDLITAFSTKSTNLPLSKYLLTLGKKFFLYEGAETNYPCDENFNWIIFNDIINIDTNSLNIIKNAYIAKYNSGSNVKSVSPLGGRPVYRNFKLGADDTKVYVYPVNSASAVKIGFIMMLAFCLFLI